MKNLRVGFNDVEDIAEHLIGQHKGVRKTRFEKYAIIKDLMKHEQCGEISKTSNKPSLGQQRIS